MPKEQKQRAATSLRKVDLEHRVFNPEWTDELFFVQRGNEALCLVCNDTNSTFKRSNLKGHFDAKHAHMYRNYTADQRKTEASRLQSRLDQQSSIFKKQVSKASESAERRTRASYEVSLLIAKKMHPFTDADFVMDCILAAVDVICPEQHDDFKAIPLSARTVTRRVEDLASDVRSSMSTNFKTLDVFSIALDESCDIKDTAQLAIFVRGVKDNLEVVEEFLRLIPMKGRTTGQDVLNALLPALSGFDLSKLVSVTTDGAPAMVGSTKGLSQLLIDHCRSLGCAQEIRMVHCIVHQEALCAKAAGIKDIMSVVVKLVNTVLARPLNHRIFKQMCEAAEADHGDLLYHTEVRWLSRGNVSKRVFALRHEIVSFVSERGLKDFQEFSDEVWLCRFGFLTDISSHLNELNLKLQGRDVLITNMEAHVRAFEVKLKLWEKQLCKRDYVHFPHLALCDAGLVDTEECVSVLLTLQNEFSSRFTDVRSHSQEFKIVSTPFDFPYDDAPLMCNWS